MLVLDSSVTLAWIFSDEANAGVEDVFRHTADADAVAPAHWRLEVANALTMAVRKGRVDLEFRRAALADLELLEIGVDEHTNARAWNETLRLADHVRLTVYDAAYLELAQRRSLPLATLDNALRTAARHLGIELRPA